MSRSLYVNVAVERPKFKLEVAFEAPPGITILFGPSGAGKSTVLGAIAGLVRPARGRIALGDDTWFDENLKLERAIDERHVAYVFQSLALFPHMTALDNVAYGVNHRSMKRAQRRELAAQMLEKWRVGHLIDRRPASFSGGEAQRVALARAFAMSPRAVLLDEPFSAMDRELRQGFAAELRAFVDEAKVPLIHVTHHRNEARALGSRVVLIDNGKLKASGTVDELLPLTDMQDFPNDYKGEGSSPDAS